MKKDRTEANRVVPMPFTAKDKLVMKLRLKKPIRCVKESKYRKNQNLDITSLFYNKKQIN